MKQEIVYVGIDVAKAHLDVAWEKQFHRLPNDVAGTKQLLCLLKAIAGEVQVICEVSGGYERVLVGALQSAGVAVSVVQASRVRQFARAAVAFWPRAIRLMPPSCAPLAKRCNPSLS